MKVTLAGAAAALAAVLAFSSESVDARTQQHGRRTAVDLHSSIAAARRSLSQQQADNANSQKFKMVKKSAAARPSSDNAAAYGAMPIMNPGTAPIVGRELTHARASLFLVLLPLTRKGMPFYFTVVERGAGLGAHNGEQGQAYNANSQPALKNYKAPSSSSSSSGSSNVSTSGSSSDSSTSGSSDSTSTSTSSSDDGDDDEDCGE